MMNGYSTTNSSKKRARSTSSGTFPTTTTTNNNNNRLLRLNVGGHPYDIIRTSLPLLETMMTDRWLDSCLLDSDGRIFLDRDGDAFGDVLRYLHGGADFLLELMNHSVRIGAAGGVGVGGEDGSLRLRNVHHHSHHYHHHGASSFGDYSTTVSTNHHPSAMMMPSSSTTTTNTTTTPQHYQMDRLRRLRTEADYYGLHQLVHDIDSITIGSKIVFVEDCWGRVAGGFHSNNNNNSGSLVNAPGVNNNNNNNNNNDDDGVNHHHHHHGNNHQDNVGQQQQQINQDDNALLHHQQQQQQQEQQQEQDVEEDDEEENDEEQAEEEDEEEDEPDEIEEDDDEEEEESSDEETYKNWSWSRQFGNPHILRPHPTHSSSMVVGQDGTYLLLLRFAAALPSPLARIKWEEEEEDRRVTRSVRARRRRRTRGGGGRVGEDGSSHGNDMGGGGGGGGLGGNDDNDDDDDDDANHSKELEEDYFVTVNIEAPLQTVMDAVDESQTHFPILRAGLWDYRTEEEVLNEDPVYATVSAMEVVSLCAGDILSVSFMNDEVSREKSPLPDDCPPELVNSLTLIKVCGNTLARYERSKQSPGFVHHGNGSFVDVHPRQGGGGGGGSSSRYSNGKNGMSPFHTPDRKSPYRRPSAFQNNASSYDQFDEDSSHDDDSNYHQQEEFDRSLTRTAHWTKPRNDFDSTPFQPRLHSDASTLEFPHPGQYLLLGRVAVGCRRDATFQPVLSGGPLEGHRAQLSVRSAGGRLLHAVGAFVFEDKPRLSGSDLSILSENGMFNDVVYIPRSGTELSIRTTGDCRLHPEGTEVGPFCSAVSQCLSLLLIDDDIMEVDRYMLRTVRTDGPNPQRQIRWYHTRSATSPRGRGKGGTSLEPSLFDVDGHRLVWRGSCCSYTHTSTSSSSSSNNNSNTTSTVLIMGSIPPLHRGYVVALLKNNQPLAISITPESLDMKGRHCHYFQEIVELKDGDELTIADCAYGERWRDLFVESRRVELDTRMGHLSFVVLLQKSGEGEGGVGVVDVGAGADESNAMMMMM